MVQPRWLDETEDRAWRGYRQMFLLLNAQVNRDMAHESGLSEPDYDVLSTLAESKNHRYRLKKLAERMMWSQSRLSHHVTRMQQRGLVTREECADDARGATIVLTKAGRKAIEAAAPLHVESVRRHFFDHLTREQVEVLGDATHAVVKALTSS
ncbi:MarR family winged helix-turn-helix transcriptional regulator [Kibdelosporangium phytohabitans]|uniref:MarR family transcriptional regulator n=1 Tax=Kibdelosporangium phytohabitans TaxID=860235 RepID=A0A0N9HWS5_9PSEU|nr:MarR family transcriptional regulator [Kibdelosporangium phytohabitans]ALG06602.1 MarR family transcriptional regulator [Kibdelosporangium phytohabitans]MBE1467803.1 DNA-binding MarR family transcriptional regulator [Kibdelosporangium phytohabitans]